LTIYETRFYNRVQQLDLRFGVKLRCKSAVTDHAITLNHVIDWDQAKVVDRENSKMDRWTTEAIHIRKEQDKSINRDEGSYQLSHIYDRLFAATSEGEVNESYQDHSEEGNSRCRNVNNKY